MLTGLRRRSETPMCRNIPGTCHCTANLFAPLITHLLPHNKCTPIQHCWLAVIGRKSHMLRCQCRSLISVNQTLLSLSTMRYYRKHSPAQSEEIMSCPQGSYRASKVLEFFFCFLLRQSSLKVRDVSHFKYNYTFLSQYVTCTEILSSSLDILVFFQNGVRVLISCRCIKLFLSCFFNLHVSKRCYQFRDDLFANY